MGPEAFSAIIVRDMEVSVTWYADKLGFEVINNNENAEMGFKQSNLKLGNVLIELISLTSAVDPEKAVSDHSSKTRLIGFFKFGFRVSDFDTWITHLKVKDVSFHGSVVNDPVSGKRMVIIKDPDGNRIQIFER